MLCILFCFCVAGKLIRIIAEQLSVGAYCISISLLPLIKHTPYEVLNFGKNMEMIRGYVFRSRLE